jgi:hypothetical protein
LAGRITPHGRRPNAVGTEAIATSRAKTKTDAEEAPAPHVAVCRRPKAD